MGPTELYAHAVNPHLPCSLPNNWVCWHDTKVKINSRNPRLQRYLQERALVGLANAAAACRRSLPRSSRGSELPCVLRLSWGAAPKMMPLQHRPGGTTLLRSHWEVSAKQAATAEEKPKLNTTEQRGRRGLVVASLMRKVSTRGSPKRKVRRGFSRAMELTKTQSSETPRRWLGFHEGGSSCGSGPSGTNEQSSLDPTTPSLSSTKLNSDASRCHSLWLVDCFSSEKLGRHPLKKRQPRSLR